jgi:hypothetical protein
MMERKLAQNIDDKPGILRGQQPAAGGLPGASPTGANNRMYFTLEQKKTRPEGARDRLALACRFLDSF